MIKPINRFDLEGNLILLPPDKDDRKIAKQIEKILKTNASLKKLPEYTKAAVEIYLNAFAKESIESLFFSEDISLEEMSELLSVDEEVLNEYAFWFCDISALNSFFKKKIFLETEIELTKKKLSENDDDIYFFYLRSLLFKKWALMLGKEFVIWKFGLKKTDITTSNFLDVLYKEAFFYYKEISLSEKEINYLEFSKIISTLVKSIKDINNAMLQSGADDNLIVDIQEALDIIITEEESPEKNTVKQLAGEIVCNSKIN